MTSKNDPIPEFDLAPRPSSLGLFLHASAVDVDGGAILFLGHSTAGKSTIARKLGAERPVLADDSVFAGKDAAGVWRVVDGGFRFDRGWGPEEWQADVRRQFQEGRGVPVRKCFRIHQAAAVRLEPMPPIELGKHLMDAAMEIDVQRKFGKKSTENPSEHVEWHEATSQRRRWFQQVAELARTCPGWHLWFAKETPPCNLLSCILQA
ncbi:MAG TPA: hypothetical protein P5204_04760 [Kiritimatiellia bacterium]|nr:hypothetical protein [Kiritimatiellia bacterium]